MKVKRIIGFNEYKMVEVIMNRDIKYIPYQEFVKKYGIEPIKRYERR